jgi:glycosyltransferase involved in cell wall biosynthesis
MKKLLITIPCYNEELVLEKTVFEIADYASVHLNEYEWNILILDNNSTDSTWKIAESIASKGNQVSTLQVKNPGRGIALRTAWGKMPGYDIYSYMDADLATDLKDFAFIVNEVNNGYDCVVGSRYLPHSDTKRTLRRKLLSKAYNVLLKAILKVDFMDAQCGFKAMSSKLVKEIVPQTTDDGWFWDAELMILASRGGYSVIEVPVSWREIRDELRVSKVSVWSEVLRNLRNIFAMRKRINK